jgi:hypothetical protein
LAASVVLLLVIRPWQGSRHAGPDAIAKGQKEQGSKTPPGFPRVGASTPKMSEEEMTKVCDVAVEGQVTAVTLVKRWVGNRPGIDIGYEYGNFECSLLVEKSLKGKFKPGETVQYTVEAYMEGKWDKPRPRGFVYEGTQAAVTPGTKLRLYLAWNPDKKQYQRVHFNAGVTVLESSKKSFPRNEGETIYAEKAKTP